MENTQECSLQAFSLCVAHVCMHNQCKYLFPSFCLSVFLPSLLTFLPFFKLALSRFHIMCFSHIQTSTPPSALHRYKCPFPIHPTLCPLLKSWVQFLWPIYPWICGVHWSGWCTRSYTLKENYICLSLGEAVSVTTSNVKCPTPWLWVGFHPTSLCPW